MLALALELGETDGETELLGLRERDALADAELLGLTEALGPSSVSARSVQLETTETSSRRRRLNSRTSVIWAPGNPLAPADGDADDDAERLALADGDSEVDALADALGDKLTDADADDDGLGERLTDAEGLLIISRMATWTAARSSDVPDEKPTERDPCPAVVSWTAIAPLAPKSIEKSSVLLAPAEASVWSPV